VADDAAKLGSYLSVALPDVVLLRHDVSWGSPDSILSQIRSYCSSPVALIIRRSTPLAPGNAVGVADHVILEEQLSSASLRDGPLGHLSGKRVFRRTGDSEGGAGWTELPDASRGFLESPLPSQRTERLEPGEMDRELQRRFQTLMENVSDVVWVMGPHMRFLYISPSIRDLLGIEAEQALNEDPFTFVPEENRAWVRSVFASKLERGAGDLAVPAGPTTLEIELLDSHGRRIPVEVRMNALRDSQGQPGGLLGIARDITERKQAEKVREVQRRVAEAASSADDLPSLCSQVKAHLSRLTDTRSFFIAMLDPVTGSVSIPFSCSETLPSLSPSMLEPLFRVLLQTGRPILTTGSRITEFIGHGEVQRLPESLACVPLRMRGEITGCLATMNFENPGAFSREDIAMLEFVSAQVAMAVERLKAIEDLRKNEQQFRGFVESSTIGIGLFALDGRPLYRNSTLYEMLDITEESASQYNLLSDPMMPPGTIEAVLKGEPVSFEVRIDFDRTGRFAGRRKGVGWILKTISEIRSPLTPRGGFLVQIQDITSLRRTELLFRTLNEASGAVRGLQTEQEILSAVGWVLSQAGITLGILVPLEEGILGVRYASLTEDIGAKGSTGPGFRLEEVKIRTSAMPGLRDLLRGGSPIFLDDFEMVKKSLPPERASRLEMVAGAIGARSMLAVPLFVGDQVEGILSVHAKDLTADDSLAVIAFANSVGSALQSCRLRSGWGADPEEDTPRSSSPRRQRAKPARH
jgi:PAS domain S-box-containing protein